MLRSDKTVYEVDRLIDIEEVEIQWGSFMSLSQEVRKVIVEALQDLGQTSLRRYIRHVDMEIKEYVAKRLRHESDEEEEGIEAPKS